MQRKTNGRTFHKHAVLVGFLQWCLCSSIIMSIGASTSNSTTNSTSTPPANSTSTPTANSTGTPTANSTGTPTTNSTGTPTANSTSTPPTNSSSTPTANSTGTPTANSTSTPTANSTGTPPANSTSTPTANSTGTPTANSTGTPTTNSTGTPTANSTGTPTTNSTSTPTANSTSNPTTNSTSNPTTNSTSTPTANSTSTSTANSTSTPTANSTSTPTANSTSTPTANSTSTPTANNTSTLSTNNTSTPSTNSTSTPTANSTSTPTANSTSTPTANSTSTPTANSTSTPTANSTSTPTANSTSTPTANNTSTLSTNNTSTPSTNSTSTPTTNNTSIPTTNNTNTHTTNNPSTEITTKPAKSDRPSSFPMPTENKNITLKLQVKLTSGEFNDSLNDPSNPDYQELEKKVRDELISAFNTSRGFFNITVTGFWKGSIGVNFTTYYQDTNLGDTNSLRKRVLSSLNSTVFNVTVLEKSLNDSIINELQSICDTSDKCPKDYRCSVNNTELQLYCDHLCNQHDCGSNAYCVVSELNQPACKCGEDDDYVYSGENCETKTEKLTMSKDKIIGIAAGVGGGVIFLLVLAIFMILLRQRHGKRSREENILDNVSEQSFQSFKGAEEATHQPTSSSEYITANGRGHSMYRLPEERAENPKFNPYLSLPNAQQPAARQQDFSQGFLPAPERARESSRNIKAKSQQFQDRVPNYGDPVQIPRFQIDLHGSDYTRTDNKRAQSSVSKTTNTRRENRHGGPLHSPAEAKVYDYSNDMELMASGTAHPLNDTDLYDFTYENQLNDNARHRSNRHQYDSPYERNIKHPGGINDPYSVQRRLV